MKKLLILLLLSLGFIGSAYANEVADSLGEVNVRLESGYHENGVISYKGNVKDGKKDGKWTWWYENGQIKTEANYKDGKLDGKETIWYDNGIYFFF